MNIISIHTAEERHILALKTYKDLQGRQANKKRAESDLLMIKKQRKTKRLRKITQGTRY